SYASMLPPQAGTLRLLAVTSRKRVGIAADIPTVAEAGYPYLGLDSLIGMYGPRGMPMALRENIAGDVRAAVEADPTIASRLGGERNRAPRRRWIRPSRRALLPFLTVPRKYADDVRTRGHWILLSNTRQSNCTANFSECLRPLRCVPEVAGASS